jgi:para-nitrobenzyl esterase
MTLADAEQIGVAIATQAGATTLADLHNLSASDLLEATQAYQPQHFCGTIDGYFLPKSPWALYASGTHAQVPLLIGWNS